MSLSKRGVWTLFNLRVKRLLAFGTGLVEGVKGMAKEGGEALEEVPWYWATGFGALGLRDSWGHSKHRF